VKSSRADWPADSKWERYLPHRTHFAFIECDHHALERMLANRRDEECLALVETIAFARAVCDVPETSFSDGAEI